MDHEKAQANSRLGGLIREFRLAAGLTQQELAERSGLSLAAVRDLEQGRVHRPRPGSLAALAAALGLNARQADTLADSAGELAPGLAPAHAGGAEAGAHGGGLWLAALGPLVAWRDGISVELPPGRRTVLGLLALQPGELVRRETVIDVLWGEQKPGTATQLAQAHVSRLRQALDAEGRDRLIEQGEAGYRLCAGPGVLDVLAFTELAGQARAAAAAGQWPAACRSYEQALRLWRGEPVADVEALRTHPAVESAVAGLVRRRAQAVTGYAEVASELGLHEQVIPLLEPLARADPLDERVHARLMVALAGIGQQASAVQMYEDLRRRLADELGVYPGEELAAAYQRILRQDIPAAAGATAAMAGRPDGRGEQEWHSGQAGLAAQASMPDAAQAGPAGPRRARSAPPLMPSSTAVLNRNIRHPLRLVMMFAITAAVIAASYTSLVLARTPSVWLKASQLPGYSRPEFCLPSVNGVPCINVIRGDTSTGGRVQVWAHGKAGDTGSLFVATPVREGFVTGDWPFKDTALDKEYMDQEWQVVQFEAAPDANPDRQCLSAGGTSQEISTSGDYYIPVTFEPCDGSSDKNYTWALWNSGGSNGHLITMVGASDKTGSTQQLSCISRDGTISQCVNGALLVAAKRGLEWSHFEPWSLTHTG
jgi:DNA-binding SARP family transcriptional activator/DNA-binding XRE family transcriptional regulator